jgi:hypothetical protein
MNMKERIYCAPGEVGKRHLKSLGGDLIPLDPLPNGFLLIHNNEGGSCFKMWIQEGASKFDRFIRCKCDLGANFKAAETPVHYRYPKRGYTVLVEE